MPGAISISPEKLMIDFIFVESKLLCCFFLLFYVFVCVPQQRWDSYSFVWFLDRFCRAKEPCTFTTCAIMEHFCQYRFGLSHLSFLISFIITRNHDSNLFFFFLFSVFISSVTFVVYWHLCQKRGGCMFSVRDSNISNKLNVSLEF